MKAKQQFIILRKKKKHELENDTVKAWIKGLKNVGIGDNFR